MAKKVDHQIFVASTLTIQEERNAVSDAVDLFNSEHSDVVFKAVRYEYDASQTADVKDAQRPIDELLCQSTIFLLIIKDTIRPISDYEFELAWNRFKDKSLPFYIFVFLQKTTDNPQCNEGEITYDKFLSNHKLVSHVADSEGVPVPHYKVYSIPFDSPDELNKRISEQLERLHDKLPPAKAKHGESLTKEDFYADPRRRNHFPSFFYRRKCDEELSEMLVDHRMVLVTGDSLSGKTRSVMEALRAVKGWVYVIGERKDRIVDELVALKKYLEKPNHVRLYVEIDNLDQHVAESSAFRDAFQDLLNVLANNSEDVLITTASNYSIVRDQFGECAHVEIPRLSEAEFQDALEWFASCGVKIVSNANVNYRRIGALFVDLANLRVAYNDYVRGNIERQSLLKAIKAQSIWRDDAFGDRALLKSMTAYFAKTQDASYSFNPIVFEENLKDLCKDGKMGVTKDKKRLYIEEYVYQYIIGYNGQPMPDYGNDWLAMAEMEKQLAREIIQYSKDQMIIDPNGFVGSESLMYQVSRILRRCSYPIVLIPWLYDLWSGNGGIGQEDPEFVEMLQSDRKQCEDQCVVNPDPRQAHFYSGIVKEYIWSISKTAKDDCLKLALEAYNSVPEALRADELFASLMEIAKTEEQRQHLRVYGDYDRFMRMPKTVLAEMKWANTYREGKICFDRMPNPCSGQDMQQLATKMLDLSAKPYDVFFYGRMLRRLAELAQSKSEFDELLALIRNSFICLISDKNLLQEISDGKFIDVEGLTIIDLMCALEWQTASKLAIRVFSDNLYSCEWLESELINNVADTLKGELTNELQMRMIVSTICARLIDSVAPKINYEDVYDTLFVPLEIEHPFINGRKIIFRNTYTYTAMMKCRGINVRMFMNLFNNDLIRHVEDSDNPLSVTPYTLNRMLAMSIRTGRAYFDQVNNLFDQLHIERDIVSYNILIESAPDFSAVLELLSKMKAGGVGVKPDKYTFLNVQNNGDVDFFTALRFIVCKDCVINGINWGKPNNHLPYVKELNQLVSSSHSFALYLDVQAWINLFSKPITTNEERDAFNTCLKYLVEKQKTLLDDGRIFNALLKNSSFVEDYKETLDLVEELKSHGFEPTYYTTGALLDKALNLKGIDQRIAVGLFNGFVKAYPKCLNHYVLVRRLLLFRKQDDSIEFVFVDKNGVPDEIRKYSPKGYIARMVELGYPLNGYAISYYMGIKGDLSQDAINQVIEWISQQDYTPDSNDIRIVHEFLLPRCEANALPEIYGRMTPMDTNNKLVREFKQEVRASGSVSKKRVEQVLNSLDWNDVNSALSSLVEMMDSYVSKFRDKRDTPGSMFSRIIRFYNYYIVGNHCKPTSFTFSLLAKSLTSLNDDDSERAQLVAELVKKEYDQIIKPPHIMGELARSVKSVEQLKRWTQVFIQIGCKPTLRTADIYVYYMCSSLLGSDSDETQTVLCDLLQYVFSEEKDRDPSKLHEDLLQGFYQDQNNFTEDLLYSLVLFNHYKAKIFATDYLVERIPGFPDDVVAGLMDQLARKNKSLAGEYVPRLFNKHRDYSSAVIFFLTSPKQLPINDIECYKGLLAKLYTFNCELHPGVIPNLLQCLCDYAGDPFVLQRLENVYSNITLGYLRQGDMLMVEERLDQKYNSWCHRSLDCMAVREKLDIIGYKIYPILIRLYAKTGGSALLNRQWKPAKALRRAEFVYASRIDENTELGELEELPEVWFQIRWKPSSQVVLAIVNAYAQRPVQTARYLVELFGSMQKSGETTRVYYKSLGNVSSNNNSFVSIKTDDLRQALPDKFVTNLCRRIVYSQQNTPQQYSLTKSLEDDFVKRIIKGKISANALEIMPALLEKSGWLMSYVNLLRMISYGKDFERFDLKVLVEALRTAENKYVLWIRRDPILFSEKKIEELTLLPSLWSVVKKATNGEWEPRQEIVLAIIGLFSYHPDATSRQIAFIASGLEKAVFKKWNQTRIGYSLLGAPLDCLSFVMVDNGVLGKALPHPYIVSLCKRTLRSEKPEGMFFDRDGQICVYQRQYLKLVKKGWVNKQQLSRLPELWRMANWVPQEEVRKEFEKEIEKQCEEINKKNP